jgi:hypothetical protein
MMMMMMMFTYNLQNVTTKIVPYEEANYALTSVIAAEEV